MINKIVSEFVFGFYFLNLLSLSIQIPYNNHIQKFSIRSADNHYAQPGTFEYQVAFIAVDELSDQIISCGGVILDKNHIITSARCTMSDGTPLPASNFRIKGGHVNITQETWLFDVKEIFVHPGFNDKNLFNNIAVIRTIQPFPLEMSGYAAIDLNEYTVRDGTKCIISGWGLNDVSLDFNLRYDNAVIINKKQCAALFPKSDMTNEVICTGRGAPDEHCGIGDEGGPLVCGGKLSGIITLGPSCVHLNYPGIYVNVAVLKPWILGIAQYHNTK